MASTHDKTEETANEAAPSPAKAAEDTRKRYDAPRLLKKRSVAQATLLTASGPTSSGIPTMG